jgi:hypothetical protein
MDFVLCLGPDGGKMGRAKRGLRRKLEANYSDDSATAAEHFFSQPIRIVNVLQIDLSSRQNWRELARAESHSEGRASCADRN